MESTDFDLFGGIGHDLQSDPAIDDLFGGDLTQFTSINHPSNMSTSTRTVSPKDLHNDLSAPPSAAFTNLTSPDLDQDMYMPSGQFDNSPMYAGLDVTGDGWYSLFPENQDVTTSQNNSFSLPLERNTSTQSLAQSSASSSNSPIILDQSNRRKSSTNNSPALNAGITKPRRRRNPLPAITVDPSDKAAIKRARNTLAARDSRQRKFEHVELLNAQIKELEAQNMALVAENERLKAGALTAALNDTT